MEDNVEELSKRIKEKEELLRKLKLVKLLRTKHDPNELEKLIKEWLAVCQQSLQDLEQKLKEQNSDSANVGIVELLKHLNIEPELVGYLLRMKPLLLKQHTRYLQIHYSEAHEN